MPRLPHCGSWTELKYTGPEGGPQRGRPSVARGIGVGDKAPDFTLPSQSGEQVRLQDRIGERVVVLYFYPKDNTSGCTAEACAFRDSHEAFSDAGAEVIGISSDSADKHAGFASKHRLPFTLLADQAARSARPTGCRPRSGSSPAGSPTSSTGPGQSGTSSTR